MRGVRHVAAVAVLALTVAACGSDGSSSEAAGDGGGESGTDDGGDRLDFRDSPLTQAIGADQAFFGFDEDEARTQQIAAEEAIRDCMAEQGFEYQPNVQQFDGGGFGDVEQQFEDPIGYAREHGFGFAESYEQSFDDEGTFEDPNQDYVESLDDSARDAYYEALYGEEPVDYDDEGNAVDADGNRLTDEELEQIYQDFRPDGCQNRAFEDVFNEGIDYEDEAFQRMNELYEEIQLRVENDPRIAELGDEYVACMADRGHAEVTSDLSGGFEEGSTVKNVYELLNEKEQELELFNDPFAGLTEEEMAEMTEEDFRAMEEEGGGSGPDPEKIAELKAFEIDLAVAHAECNEPLEQERLSIQFEAEQEVVDDPANQELFDELRALFGGAGEGDAEG